MRARQRETIKKQYEETNKRAGRQHFCFQLLLFLSATALLHMHSLFSSSHHQILILH